MVFAYPATPNARERFAQLEQRLSPEEYNFTHFRTKHLIRDAARTAAKSGIQPGELAPEFELPTPDGSTVRWRDLRGKPILLKFGSFT